MSLASAASLDTDWAFGNDTMADYRAYQPIKPAASRKLAKHWDDKAYQMHKQKVPAASQIQIPLFVNSPLSGTLATQR